MLVFFLACETATLDIGGHDSHDSDVDTSDTSDTGDSAETGDTDTGVPPIEFDCDALPEADDTEMTGDAGGPGPRAYHDVVFDDDGHLIGNDLSSLLSATYEGGVTPMVPGTGMLQGMDRLPDGDLVVVDDTNGTLVRVSPEGATSIITTGMYGTYGVTTGPDGMLYAAPVYQGDGSVVIARVDPETGDTTEWAKLSRVHTPRIVVFNLDSTIAYVATIGTGTVFQIPVDDNLDPTGQAEDYATGIGSWMDGLGIDACGNLYVAEYASSGLYRVRTDSSVESLVRKRPTPYGHGLEWGSGIGGWRTDALYQPQPYDNNTVREVVIGVPSGAAYRTWR